MEEKLCWCEASQVGVLNKASALRAVVVFDEMRQRSVLEAKGDSFTLHVLLAHHSNNLKEEEDICLTPDGAKKKELANFSLDIVLPARC